MASATRLAYSVVLGEGEAGQSRFNIPSVGPLSHFLGMDIQYKPDSRKMFISQEHTVDVLLERAKMQDCNPAQTPCPAGTVFTKKDCPASPSPRTTEYASLVALANYLACWTRPDIAFVVNKLCKYMSNPGDVHFQVLKHLLRYLKGKHKGLCFDLLTLLPASLDFTASATLRTETAPTLATAPWLTSSASTTPCSRGSPSCTPS